jgi:hypothetical protein
MNSTHAKLAHFLHAVSKPSEDGANERRSANRCNRAAADIEALSPARKAQ